MKSTTIIIGGDLAPTRSNYSLFTEGNIKALIDDKLLSVLQSADHRIFNLELPLTDIEKPISKDGPNLLAPVSTLNGIKLLNPTILGLANNHILDHDEQGLNMTIEQLSANNIGWVGAGKDLANAAKPVFIENCESKRGITECAENEYWETSVILKATFGNKMSVDFVPICKKGTGVVLPDAKYGETILKAFYDRSQEISITGFIESEYEKFCDKNGLYYLGAFAGLGRILRKVDGLMNGILTRQIYSRKKLNMLQNFIECEAHRELFLKYLHKRRKKY